MVNDPFYSQVLKDQARERLTQLREKRLLALFFQDSKEKLAKVKRDQLIAAVLLPFFIVTAMAFAVVINGVVLELVPGGGPVDIILFMVGTALFIGTFVACFFWVKTGGFSIFRG